MKRFLLAIICSCQLVKAEPYIIPSKYGGILATIQNPFVRDNVLSDNVVLGIDNLGNGYIEFGGGDCVSGFTIKGGDTIYDMEYSYFYSRNKPKLDMKTFFTLSNHDKKLLEDSHEIRLLVIRVATFTGNEYLDKIKLKKE